MLEYIGEAPGVEEMSVIEHVKSLDTKDTKDTKESIRKTNKCIHVRLVVLLQHACVKGRTAEDKWTRKPSAGKS